LGHRRLAILDLDGGAQPMDDGTGELWVTFNGEIYNHLELRAELEARGCRFRTRSDTEVLVHGYRVWGARLVERLNGMFAFAIVDERSHTLFAARDRLGKKPFHYAEHDGRIFFGSEIKALLARPEISRRLDPQAVARYLCLRYVPDPHTIFAGIKKLPPGHTMLVADGRVEVRRYWHLSFASPSRSSMETLSEEALHLLDDSVEQRLMSDVPLGAFLSGGVDSHAVVDSMSRTSADPVVACSMGFEDHRFDERPHARAAAEACGAELREGVVRSDHLLDHGWYSDTFDEPFADSSAIPTYLVSKLARQHVTVALSGDGGDESFAGYRRYRFDWLENRCRGLMPSAVFRVFGGLYPKADFLPRQLRFKRTLQNLALDPAEAYARSVSASLPEEVAAMLSPDHRAAAEGALSPVIDAYRQADGPDPLSRACAADFATYLPGDILTKVDRASMAVSLEVRAPLLDYRLVEFAARLPSRLKLAGHQTKGFLRTALSPRLGRAAMNRRKQGFSVPLREWMAGSSGDALAASLDSGRLDDLIDVARARELLTQHRSGVVDGSELLWAVLSLDRFIARWVE